MVEHHGNGLVNTPTDVLHFFDGKSSKRLAYRRLKGSVKEPGVMLILGLKSEMMNSRKADALEDYCRRTGRSFLKYDARGHGLSSGTFGDCSCCLGEWIQDALDVVDQVAVGSQILVGCSVGAWVALHVAQLRPGRIRGVIGVGAAPDYFATTHLEVNLSEEQSQDLEQRRVACVRSDYVEEPIPVTRWMLRESRQWNLLGSADRISLERPVRLLHGVKDDVVPWQLARQLCEALPRASLTLISGGDHRLSEPSDLQELVRAVESMAGK